MDQVKWRRPINYIMFVFFVLAVLSYIPGIPTLVKPFLLIPAIISLGYFFEYGFPNSSQLPSKSLVRPRNLLFPLGAMIFILVSGAWENKPFLVAITEPILWVGIPFVLTLWLVGSTLYRYFHLSLQE